MPREQGGSPLFKRTLRATIQIIGGLGVGLFVAVLLVAWRLSSGPVSLTFLTPMIESSLNELHDGSFSITLEDTILAWAGWERTLDIRVVNMRVKLPEGNQIALVPEVSVSFSAEALIKGSLAPRSIELFGPDLVVVRGHDGAFEVGLESEIEGSDQFIARLVGTMLQAPDIENPMSYLSRISVVAARLTYIDTALGATWHAPTADAQLRRVDGGLDAEFSLGLEVGAETADISILGSFEQQTGRIDLGFSFDALKPSEFSKLSPELDLLTAIDLPVSGTATLSMRANGQVEGFGFDLQGKAGHLSFPVPLASQMGLLSWAQRLEVSHFAAAGRFEGEINHLELDNLELRLEKGETLYLPAPIGHDLPVRAIMGAGRVIGADRRLEIDHLELDLGGAVANVRAKVNGFGVSEPGSKPTPMSLGLTGSLKNMRFDRLERFWPRMLAPEVRNWVLSNISNGYSPKAEVVLSMISDDQGVHIEQLSGTIEGRDMDVDYLSQMPKVRRANASATFDRDSFDITIDRFESETGIALENGDVHLTGLDGDDPQADLLLNLVGPIPAALTLLENDPFKFSNAVGISPQDTQGTAAIRLNIQFPLSDDVLLNDVTIRGEADLVDAGFKDILFGRDMINGNLKLVVDKFALNASGTAQLGGVPVGLLWRHDYGDDALFRDKYELTGIIQDVLGLGDIGIDVPEFIARYIGGGAEANVSYTVFGDDRRALSARIDLTKIALAIPELGWSKVPGVPGAAVLELRMKGESPVDIPSFEISAPNMDIGGSVSFRDDGELEVINLEHVISNRTSVAGSLIPHDDGTWEVSLIGDEFDASLLWKDFLGLRDVSPDEKLVDAKFAFSGAADFKKLWFGKDRAVEDFIGTIYRKGKLWKKIDMEARVGATETINFRLETYETRNERRLGILSNNAGAALRALDIYDLVIGGKLRMEATYRGMGIDSPLSGILTVRDYSLQEAPALANLVGVLSLTGVGDALRGEGVSFDILEVPFTLKKGVLGMTEARTSGSSIGITATGTVDLQGKRLDVKGTVVPAYAINSLLGDIPIIGSILSGPEKGSGIFAATYSMKSKGDDVEIKFNPLSALAPGVLRGIFSGSGQEKDIKTDGATAPK